MFYLILVKEAMAEILAVAVAAGFIMRVEMAVLAAVAVQVPVEGVMEEMAVLGAVAASRPARRPSLHRSC